MNLKGSGRFYLALIIVWVLVVYRDSVFWDVNIANGWLIDGWIDWYNGIATRRSAHPYKDRKKEKLHLVRQGEQQWNGWAVWLLLFIVIIIITKTLWLLQLSIYTWSYMSTQLSSFALHNANI